MSKQFLAFRKEFLKEEQYQQTKTSSQIFNSKYEELCNLFEKEFKICINGKTTLMRDKNMILPYDKENSFGFIVQLSAFISDFLEIIQQMSLFQIQCLRNLKENNFPEFEILPKLKQKVKENKLLCEELQTKANLLFQTFSETKNLFFQMQKDFENPIKFYQRQMILVKSSKLKSKISENWRLMNDIMQKKKYVQQRIEQFQPYLYSFRKKLLKNKYTVLKKMINLIKNTKNAIMQMLLALKNCAQVKKQQYNKISMIYKDDITYLRQFWQFTSNEQYIEHYSQQNIKWQKLINLSQTQFQKGVSQIQSIFAQLMSYFNNTYNKFKVQNSNLWALLMQISELFQDQESPYNFMKELFDVQQLFLKKVEKIIVRLQQILTQLRLQKNNCTKQAQMFLTLIKINKINHKSINQSFKQQRNEQMIQLISQFSFATVKNIVLSFYDQCIGMQTDLLGNFDSAVINHRKTLDSMDISHSEAGDQYIFDKRIPRKQEVWLYKEWKREIQVNFQSYNDLFQEIQKYLQNITNTLNIRQSSVIDKFYCILIARNKEINGVIEVKMNSLDFSSDNLKLCIGWKQVTNIISTKTIFKEIISIETQKGKIKFYKFEKDLSIVQNSIKDAQQKGMMSKSNKLDRKPLVQMSEQQIKFMNQRKQKIKSQLPNMDTFNFLVQDTQSSQRIDQVYELFYSDKPFTFYGKQEPCFFSYTGKKAGNYNWVAQKYDKPGPEFYTSNKQITFKNCPLSSTRNLSFTHPMKPSSIPFMPKFCLTKDTRKMFWVSNQQLIYLISSVTEGVPYADHFVVNVLHRITKVQNGVNIKVFMQIQWHKQTMMKSTIQSSIVPQVKENMTIFLGEIRKTLKLMEQIDRGQATMAEKVVQEQKNQTNAEPPQQSSLQKLKLQNKVLLIAFGILVLFNLINMIYF